MDELLLEKIGLSRGEGKVFLALNRIGDSSIGKIVEESAVSKSKVYDILDKLVKKGLIGYAVRSGIKYFFVNSPHTLLDYVNEKEKQVSALKAQVVSELPSLEKQRKSFSSNRVAEIFEGINGIKSIRMELLNEMPSGSELLVLGAPRVYNERMEGWLLKEFHTTRRRHNVSMRIIYNSDTRDYGAKRERMKLTRVKYLPNDLSNPTWVDVFKNALLIVIFTQKPVAFVVRDKEATESFRSYFELLWNISVK
jgi:sugar-specific transcriptional regulator TrmB